MTPTVPGASVAARCSADRGTVPQFQRDSRHAGRGLQFGLGASDRPALHPGKHEFGKARLGPELDPLALFGVGGRGLAGLGLALFGLGRDHRRPDLALQVGGPAFDLVQLRALFV